MIAFFAGLTYISIMDNNGLLQVLSALAQATRLKVVALLAEAGSAGMASGEIADAVGTPRHLMSAHLAVLSKAGVIVPQKKGRSVFYTIDRVGVLDVSSHLRTLVQSDRDLARTGVEPND